LDEANPEIMLAHEPTKGDSQSVKALIWNLGTLDGSRMLWHGGGTFGMSSQVVLFPSYNEGYVLLANDTCNGTESALKNLAIVLHGRLRSSVRPPPGDFRP
jgi:hypothetical protein